MSAPDILEPVATPDTHGGTISTHPAFGQISVHRLSVMGGPGNGAALYGSDFMHQNTVRIAIHHSELNRHLSHDWHHPRDLAFEVELSEAQWATFVSSMNMGSGVPCTLTRTPGPVPGLPVPVQRTEQFKAELMKHTAAAREAVRDTLAELESLGLPKGKAEALRGRLKRAQMELGVNSTFVADSFDQHMERTVEKAKVEIHGYANAVLHATGLAALAQQAAPVALPAPDKKEEPK